MNDKLEWLKDNLPDGWDIGKIWKTDDSDWWMISGILSSPDFHIVLHLDYGDIGLAPLTALLKQELGCWDVGIDTTVGGYCASYILGHFKDRVVGKIESTEFQAVFNAYKEMRETNLG